MDIKAALAKVDQLPFSIHELERIAGSTKNIPKLEEELHKRGLYLQLNTEEDSPRAVWNQSTIWTEDICSLLVVGYDGPSGGTNPRVVIVEDDDEFMIYPTDYDLYERTTKELTQT